MKKFIKAVIIGYAVLWAFNSIREMLGEKEVTTLDDIKKLIKERLYPRLFNQVLTFPHHLFGGEIFIEYFLVFYLGIDTCP